MDNQIFELINNLSSLTTFEVSFLKDDYTFIGQDSFFNYLRQKLSYEVQHLTKLLIFPFISNDRLKGYFLVKSNKPFIKEQVNLIRLMLKSAFISAFDQQLRINVLYPLTDQKLKDFLFILKNSNISKGGGSTPPPEICATTY